MQVSSDEALKFVSRTTGRARDSERDWFRVTVTDQDGEIINLYTDINTYDRLSNKKIGDPLGLVIRVRPAQRGVSLTVVDLVG